MNTPPQNPTLISPTHTMTLSTLSLALQADNSGHHHSVTSGYVASNVTLSKQSLEPPISTSRLLALPRELRDHIFLFALGEGPTRLDNGRIEMDLVHFTPTISLTTLPRLVSRGLYPRMRTSKQVLTETLDIVSRVFTSSSARLSCNIASAFRRSPTNSSSIVVPTTYSSCHILSSATIPSPVVGS